MASNSGMSSKMIPLNDLEKEFTQSRTDVTNLNVYNNSFENPDASTLRSSSTISNSNFSKKIKNFLRPWTNPSIRFKHTTMNNNERTKFLDEMKENYEISQARGKIHNVYLLREETYVQFSYFYFFKFLIYHILFFFTFGPIFGLLLIPFEGYYMVKNMGFIGISSTSINQYLTYLACAPNIIFRLYCNSNESLTWELLDLSEMIFCNLAVIVRCFIIGFRYGFTNKSQIEKRYLKEIPDLKREYIIFGWRFIEPSLIDIEVQDSLVRTNVDAETFKFNFLSQCYDEWIKRLTCDNYYKTIDKSFLKRMYYPDSSNREIEEEFTNQLRKNEVLLDKNIYSTLTPFLNKVKTEKELTQFYSNNKDYSENSSFIDKNIKSINCSNEEYFKKPEYLQIKNNNFPSSGNERLDNIRIRESYKLSIKKLAKVFNSIRSNEDRRITYPVEQKKLPFYLRTPKVEEIFFDYPGRLIMRELMYLSRVRTSKLFTYFVGILIFLHSFIAVIYRWIYFNKPFGHGWVDFFCIIYNILVFIVVFYASMLFVEIGGNDYSRRLFCMKALSAMITPDKSLLSSVFKLIPTINFFCPVNLNSWFNTRLLSMDIGLRFMKRMELYANSFLITYLLIVVFLLLGNFGILKNFNFENYPVLFLVGYTQAWIFCFVIYRMMLLGVKLNNYFQIHKSELSYIKSTIKYILMNWEIFMNMSTYVNPYLTKAKEFYHHCQEYHRKFSTEKIYEHRLYGTKIPKSDEEFKEYMQKLIECYDVIIERIELEETSKPVKLIGFKIDSDFMKDFYITVVTLLVSLFQYVFIDNKDK
jgi:hypothetical protein